MTERTLILALLFAGLAATPATAQEPGPSHAAVLATLRAEVNRRPPPPPPVQLRTARLEWSGTCDADAQEPAARAHECAARFCRSRGYTNGLAAGPEVPRLAVREVPRLAVPEVSRLSARMNTALCTD